jgi:hypothetical protein
MLALGSSCVRYVVRRIGDGLPRQPLSAGARIPAFMTWVKAQS